MCTSPLRAVLLGIKSNGKQDIRFCKNDYKGNKMYETAAEDKKLKIPCQQCVECRLKYSKMWATRCMLETKEHEHNYFITLTYDDDHLPTSVNKLSGEILPNLVPEHLTTFMKDLRDYYAYHYNWQGIRFYACGEYGEQFGRCHFHIILFNCPIDDKVYLGKSVRGDKYYTSPTFEKKWGKGYVSITNVTFESCAYVARYVMKKLKDKSNTELYEAMKEFSISKQDGIDLLGRVPEFVRMSRKPGIGRNYYEQNKDKIYETDEIILPGKDGKPRVVKPPSYYDKLFDIEQNGIMQQIKEQRKQVAIENMKQVLSNTTLTEEEYMKVKERKKLNQVKYLPRSLNTLNC